MSTLANEFTFSFVIISNNGKRLDGFSVSNRCRWQWHVTCDRPTVTSPIQSKCRRFSIISCYTVPASAQQNDVFNIQLIATDKVVILLKQLSIK